MARYTGPRLRAMRALGTNLPGLSAKTIDKRPTPPGQHGLRRRKAPSIYGKRLAEKQKLRLHYGISERQMRVIAAAAARSRTNATTALVRLLEERLDNVVFRAGFARTIPAARQLVTHGHILVDGKRLSYPGARVKPGAVITATAPRAVTAVRAQQEKGIALAVPEWLEVDNDKLTVRMSGTPDVDAVPFPIDLSLIVEFYS